ncbi:MAG TPA: ABC transporter substrate-binding protein [Pyrinomonadaceae bacterium]|jgi:iron complex transport system substrate-binding protein
MKLEHRTPISYTAALCLYLLVFVVACNRGPSNQPRSGVNVNDAGGQAVTVSDSSRIVSVGTAVTETIIALGARARLVGVDNSSSEYLPEVQDLPKTGPRTTLNAEGILSLKPTLVIATADAGPPQVLDQLRGANVAVLTLPVNYTVDAVKEKIRTIARALELDARGAELVAGIDRDMGEVAYMQTQIKTRPKVMFVGRGPNMPNATMSGTGTTIDEMIRLAGGTNPMTSFQGFREMTDEAVVAAAPDVILLTDKSFERSGGIDGVLKFPGVALTPAGRDRRITHVSDMYFQGFGPGVGHAVADLTLKLHPEVRTREAQAEQGYAIDPNGRSKSDASGTTKNKNENAARPTPPQH